MAQGVRLFKLFSYDSMANAISVLVLPICICVYLWLICIFDQVRIRLHLSADQLPTARATRAGCAPITLRRNDSNISNVHSGVL
jgi:hypothetical protein